MPALQQSRMCHSGQRRRAGSSRPGPRPAGVSLAELLVSLVIIAILMTAMGSVMVLTGHVVGLSAAHAGEARVDDVVATIAAEQRLASRVVERTARSITFVVDRDHDGVSETVRYAWSGIPGDPLTRSSNGGVPVVLIPKVNRFNLSYVLKSTAAVAPVPDVEIGSDVLLYSHDGGSAAASVTSANWVGQYFKPDWAAVAPGKTVTAWRVTRVEFVASRVASGTNTAPWIVRLYPATSGTDLRPVVASKLDEQTMAASSMTLSNSPTLRYSSGAFVTNAGLDTTKGMVITVGPNTTSPSGYVGFDAASSDAAGQMVTSANSGGGYTVSPATRDLRVRVYGRYKYPGP
jgi:prepilin-type N-terminal cleavage/methylation domain-containing protein